MGYQTVKKVPTFIDYFNAHRWWENTKPIRGRSVDLRPLAERRYADCYSIRKNPSNDAIECVLYQTPVVTFMPDGVVEVRNGGYVTASTHMFIQETVGTGVKVQGQRGKTIVRVGGQALVLGRDEVLRLRKNENGRLQPLVTQTHYAYRINRKGANIVRARFKEFYDYFKGFIKLRAEETQGTYYGPMRTMINCTFTELADSLGSAEYWDKDYLTVNVDNWRGLTMKPGTYTGWHKINEDEYKSTVNKFLDLIKSDQPEENKHINFHKAALVVLSYKHTNIVEERGAVGSRSVWLDVVPAKTTLDTTLFKWFAPEVLERYEVPRGKLPETKYNSWMEGENT
jgi:hypothetical protein